MSRVVDIARDVVSLLNENIGVFSMNFTAVYEPYPRQDLQKVTGLEVFVTPDSCNRIRETRDPVWSLHPVIQIGFLKRIDRLNRGTEVDNLVTLMDEVGDYLSDKAPASHPYARLIEFGDRPLYYYEHYYSFSVFSGTLDLKYRLDVKI